MDNLTQIDKHTAETAEAEKTEAAAELGKFKDVKALYEAYTSLEAEFTRRSQRLKDLENANKEKDASAEGAGSATQPSQGQDVYSGERFIEAAVGNEQVRNAVIGEYLQRASKNKAAPIITGGVNVAAKRRTPSSVKEAGRLAQQFLNKRED